LKPWALKTVINLRDTNSDPKAALGTKLVLLNPGITTWSFTDDDIIKALCAVTHAQRPVLVHCRHGADRTGLIIALIRIIDEGWSVEDAKKEMLEGGYGFTPFGKTFQNTLIMLTLMP
jgi:Protein tyrosine/serine phosphatase